MLNHDFRHDARLAITRAKRRLDVAPQDVGELRYAALDARLAMEALTYDRACLYGDELPTNAFETWQPRKLLQALLDIDPSADAGGVLSVGTQETPSAPAPAMQDFGGETVLNLVTVKRHYDALGSYLHAPTIKQLGAGQILSADRLAARLTEIIAYVEEVLASTVINVYFGVFSSGRCLRCAAVMRWRMPWEGDQVEAVCRECSAPHDLTRLQDGQVRWRARQSQVRCPDPACGVASHLWLDDIRPGGAWICSACEGQNEFGLVVRRSQVS